MSCVHRTGRSFVRRLASLAFALSLVAFGATACGLVGGGDDTDASSSGGAAGARYSNEVRTNFLDACIDGGATAGDCEQVLRCLERELTELEFLREEMRMAMGEPSDELVDLMMVCTRLE